MISAESFLPDTLPVWSALILIATSFFTSALTAAVGLGGGVALIAVMGAFLPVALLIPVHGVVQLGSNAGRAIVQRAHMDWSFVLYASLGGLVGALIGGKMVIALPDAPMRAALGLFILFMVWGPKPTAFGAGTPGVILGSGIATFLTMFFGATGPFIGALLAMRKMTRHRIVATHAGTMVVQHLLKVAVFGFLGFQFGVWLPLMIAMIAVGFAGTLAGTLLFDRLPERSFQIAFRGTLTLLALNLIVQAFR